MHSQPKSKVGTPGYIAPEVILNKRYDGKVGFAEYSSLVNSLEWLILSSFPSNPTRPGHALSPSPLDTSQIADIWSCGVMLYVMLVGAYPFERVEDKGNPQKLQAMITVTPHPNTHQTHNSHSRTQGFTLLIRDASLYPPKWPLFPGFRSSPSCLS